MKLFKILEPYLGLIAIAIFLYSFVYPRAIKGWQIGCNDILRPILLRRIMGILIKTIAVIIIGILLGLSRVSVPIRDQLLKDLYNLAADLKHWQQRLPIFKRYHRLFLKGLDYAANNYIEVYKDLGFEIMVGLLSILTFNFRKGTIEENGRYMFFGEAIITIHIILMLVL